MLAPDEQGRGGQKKKSETAVRYQSDNEMIIQPNSFREPKNTGLSTLFNVGIGLVLGIASMFFLILPAAVNRERTKAQEEIRTIGDEMDVKTATIATMQQTIDEITEENSKLHEELDAYVGTDGTLRTIDILLQGASEYLETADAAATESYLDDVLESVNNLNDMSEPFGRLYNNLLLKIGPELSASYFASGNAAYNDEDYDAAIADLTKAVNYDATNGDALFTLGNAYRRAGKNAEAIEVYERVIELFPGTQRAARAQNYINDLRNQ